MSEFESTPLAPTDAIFLVKQKYEADQSPKKVDVGIGAYRDSNGKPLVLNVVREAEKRMLENPAENHEYLGINGSKTFIEATKRFAFGEQAACVQQGTVATVQSLSGTGALRLGMDFLFQTFGSARQVLIPTPTWGNHRDICTRAKLSYTNYRYWSAETKGLDFSGMISDLNAAKDGSIILLHMCAHNPTGVDPTPEQWGKILEVCKQKKFLPFFDAAYQGFATGDCDKDAFSLRLFEQNDLELLLAQSYSKNMGLYGERIGALNIICKSKPVAQAVESQLKKVIRAMYSNPPRHGAGIVGMILSDPEMKKKWLIELKEMADRINAMRLGLRTKLEKSGAQGDWSFITSQIGMFTYTGLEKEQVAHLTDDYHIYMPSNGRISMAGLTEGTLDYVAGAIKSVL